MRVTPKVADAVASLFAGCVQARGGKAYRLDCETAPVWGASGYPPGAPLTPLSVGSVQVSDTVIGPAPYKWAGPEGGHGSSSGPWRK